MILKDKVAVVTGSSRGIGRAIALRFARDGALVCVNYRGNAEAATAAVAEIRQSGGEAFALQADVGSVKDLRRFFEALDAELTTRKGDPGIDILVNNAGIAERSSVVTATEEGFDRVFATNVKGPFFMVQHALTRLRDGGRIINVSSNLSRRPMPEGLPYCMTKAAIDNFTVGLAAQLGKRGITVNTLAPGLTTTDLNAEFRAHPGVGQLFSSITALGRIDNPLVLLDGFPRSLPAARLLAMSGVDVRRCGLVVLTVPPTDIGLSLSRQLLRARLRGQDDKAGEHQRMARKLQVYLEETVPAVTYLASVGSPLRPVDARWSEEQAYAHCLQEARRVCGQRP